MAILFGSGGTMEQGCSCKNGGVGWSASGACSFGTGKPTAKKSVKSQADCAKKSTTCRGDQTCTNACTSVVGRSSSTGAAAPSCSWAARMRRSPTMRTMIGLLQRHREAALQVQEWRLGWSASGACSFGTGKPTAKKSRQVLVHVAPPLPRAVGQRG